MTELWLVRHGQTDWNMAGIYQGQSDIPLNQTGIAQAEKLAGELSNVAFDAVYASDLIRAVRTAEIIIQSKKLDLNLDERLREIDQGEWEGITLNEVREKYASDFLRGASEPLSARAPGGESVAEVTLRMLAAANDILQQHHGGKILVVSHGLALATLYCVANQVSLQDVYRHIPENAHATVVRIDSTLQPPDFNA